MHYCNKVGEGFKHSLVSKSFYIVLISEERISIPVEYRCAESILHAVKKIKAILLRDLDCKDLCAGEIVDVKANFGSESLSYLHLILKSIYIMTLSQVFGLWL